MPRRRHCEGVFVRAKMSIENVVVHHEAVNEARVKRGLNRQEFYGLVGCDTRTGTKFLRGGRVHISTVRKVAEALGMKVPDVADVAELLRVTT